MSVKFPASNRVKNYQNCYYSRNYALLIVCEPAVNRQSLNRDHTRSSPRYA